MFFFFFNDTATTEIYTLSLHDALPICVLGRAERTGRLCSPVVVLAPRRTRSEEHTSELQSQSNLVCRLLLEKKKKRSTHPYHAKHCSQSTRESFMTSRPSAPDCSQTTL